MKKENPNKKKIIAGIIGGIFILGIAWFLLDHRAGQGPITICQHGKCIRAEQITFVKPLPDAEEVCIVADQLKMFCGSYFLESEERNPAE